MPPVVVLGPQRHDPNVASSLQALGVEGGIVALITAGWEERESEVDELAEHLGHPIRNLGLFRRAEEVVAGDPELLSAWVRLRRRVREHEEMYRIRLDALIGALRQLDGHGAHPARRMVEIDGTLEMLRALDAHQETEIRALYAAFLSKHDIPARDTLTAHRAELLEQIDEASAVALAGGNVAVLYNRLRLFGLEEALAQKPIVAWSAGAMVLAERIVLFHDEPPWGEGRAVVYGPGLGFVPDIVPFPHARERLRLDDPARLGLLARRMQPRTCVALESGSGLLWSGSAWSPVAGGARSFTPEGGLAPFGAEGGRAPFGAEVHAE